MTSRGHFGDPLFSTMQKKIPSWLSNKYLLTGLAAAVWMMWFDGQDLPGEFRKAAHYGELEASEARLNQQIQRTQNELNLLINNPKTVEQYAREKYLMKKDNEDLFLVVDSPAVK